MNMINNIINKIANWKPSVVFSYIVFAIWIITFFIVSCFHEPWLDEAQAWLIARDVSYHDILFTMPHYEGHPSLWWLVLSVPAKLHLPYEMSLTVVSLIFSAVTVYLIIFKSPFFTAFKFTLPFSFFIFYQYGVIARPYCMLICAMMFAAVFYKNRDEKPFRFILSLLFLCMTSGYGIVLAGGIAIEWCIAIISKFKSKSDLLGFFKTRRFAALFTLLVSALAVVWSVRSADDVFTWAVENNRYYSVVYPYFMLKGRLISILYMLFLIPGDSMLVSNHGLDSLLINYSYNLNMTESVILLLPSILVLSYLLTLCYKKGKLSLFLIPYIIFALFSTFVYFNMHHLGIITIFFVFIIWVCTDSEDVRSIKLKLSDFNFKQLEFLMIACYAVVNIMWCSYCSVSDIIGNYDYGRDFAQYIKDNHYEDKNIFVETQGYEKDGVEYTNTNAVYCPVPVLPYFSENIFMNFNCGRKDETFVMHKVSDNEADYEEWSKTIPDLLVGVTRAKSIYGDSFKLSDYKLDCEIGYGKPWKMSKTVDYLLVRTKI